jgi:hypothetical protein
MMPGLAVRISSGVAVVFFTIEFVDGRSGSGDAQQRHWKGSISGQS